jgi:hypothetical protein
MGSEIYPVYRYERENSRAGKEYNSFAKAGIFYLT